jgi:hypothetical protein
MVAKNGSMSPWRYLSVNVIPRPSLDMGLKLNTSFSDGKYKMSLPMSGLGNVLGGKIGLLDDIPLLNKAESFGLDFSNITAEGIMEEDFWVTFGFGGGGGYGEKTTTKKIKRYTAKKE